MIGPSMVVMLGLLTLPLLTSIVWSFQKVTYAGGGQWVGFENYVRAMEDPEFRTATLFTVSFAIVQTACIVVLGYGLALLMNRARRGRSVFLGLLLVPFVVPAVLSATTFGWLFDDNFGGLVNVFTERVFGTTFEWFSSTWPNRIMILMAVIWISVPFAMIIFLAAIKGVPGELVEAAEVDGAGWWQRQWHVVLPQVAPMIFFVTLIAAMDGLRLFDPLIPLSPAAGANGNMSVSLYVYQRAFARANQDLGLGSAVNILMLLVMIPLVIPMLRNVATQVRNR